MHCGGRGDVLWCGKSIYVVMLLNQFTGEELYARRVAAIFWDDLSLADDVPVTHSLDYVDFTRPFHTLHF